MSFIKIKSSLGNIWYSLICFLIEISCHIDNIYLNNIIIDEKSKYIILITIIGTSISIYLNILNRFTNNITNNPFYLNKTNQIFKSYPYLSLFNIYISILIFLLNLFIQIEIIQLKLKDQSNLFI